MKYFLRIVLVLFLCTGVVGGMYVYTNGLPSKQDNKAFLTTVTKPAATEKNANRVLLATLEKEDFSLYKGSKGIVLTHGKEEYEFSNWSRFIERDTTTMYYADFDGDKQKELLVRAVGSVNAAGQEVYELYLLKEKTDDGKSYDVIHASQATYLDIITKKIREEINQLSCKKIVQFSMTTADKTIKYDSKTKLATNSGYSGYFRAVQDDSGNYLTLDEWQSGDAVYTVSKDNKICVEAPITVSYKDSKTVQNAGNLYFELTLDDKGAFFVTSRTMVFQPDKRYLVSDPRDTAQEPWSYTEHNEDKTPIDSAKAIDWIKYTPQYSATVFETTQPFDENETDLGYLSDIVLTESYVELVAKSGCAFDTASQKKKEYSVIINRGKENEYEISYTSSLTQKDGHEVLRIQFDKAYPQSEIQTVQINFGTK